MKTALIDKKCTIY